MTNWCFTGAIENWFYGLDRAVWATNNEHNHLKWFKEMLPGDNAVIYVTGIGVVGWCSIDGKAPKGEPWWADEVDSSRNLYPNVIYIKDVSIVADIRDTVSLRKIGLSAPEWRVCGLTQRNITGGINVIRESGVFDCLQDALLDKTQGSMTTLHTTSGGHTDIGAVRKAIEDYVRGSRAVIWYDDSGLGTDDIDSDTTPERMDTIVQLWRRNKLIVKERKIQTRDKCEIPGCVYQPFEKTSGGRYSEGHHIIPLGKPGAENPRNIAVLCPNHHREIHFGSRREDLTRLLHHTRGL